MSRLIGADLLKKNCKCTGEFEDNFKCVSLSELARVIDEQPTAFDANEFINEIVDKLQELKMKYSNLALMYNDLSEIKKYIGMAQAIAVAIEIVKEGRVE